MDVGTEDVAEGFRTGGYSRDDEPVDGQGGQSESGKVGACDIYVG
jgi:hypothetical protein